MYSIIFFLGASILLNVNVVLNDNFKLGSEGVKDSLQEKHLYIC